MLININDIEVDIKIDCAGYWLNISDFCEEKGGNYGDLKTLIPEIDHNGHYSSLEELEVDGKYYLVINWLGSKIDTYMHDIPYIKGGY